MQFERVNDHMIKCLISEDDMVENGISIEDFFTRNESAMEFLHEIVRMAEEEVDYRPEGPLTSLQIAPIPDNGVAIFLTEDTQVDMKHIIDSLKKIPGANIPENIVDKIQNATATEQAEFLARFMENVKKEVAKNAADTELGLSKPESRENETAEEKPAKQKNRKEPMERAGEQKKSGFSSNLERKIFAFDSASDVLRYASAVEMPGGVESCLYKDDDHGTFYLCVERNGVTTETLAGVYLTAYEYGHYVSDRAEQMSFIKEHCECIIAEDALQKMKR